MIIRHIHEAKKSLGDSTLELLKTIFDQSRGLPPSVPATRFRANHPKWMDQLTWMGHSGLFIKWDQEKDMYRVSGYALPLVDSIRASTILSHIETIYMLMQHHYSEYLRQPLRVSELLDDIDVERDQLIDALCYMRDVDGWWSSLGSNFPLGENGEIVINEEVLKYQSFGELISKVYESSFTQQREQSPWPTLAKEYQAHRPRKLPEQLDSTSKNINAEYALENLLHPAIRKAALPLFLDGHLREAVLNSIVAVFDLIRAKTELTEDGDRLIGKAFSLDEPLLVLSDLNTDSGQNDQKGFMQIFKGAYQGIRNPKAHSLTHDLTELKAAQYLVFASLLARRVEEAIHLKGGTSK